MKPEEKYLDHLFESAREEEPHTSLESVSETFLSASAPTGLALVKEMLLKNFSLNSIVIVTVGTIAIFSFGLLSPAPSNISNNNSPSVTNLSNETSVLKEVPIAIENPKIETKVNKKTISDVPQKVVVVNKKRIVASPKIGSTLLFLKNNKDKIKPEIIVENHAQVKITPPRTFRNKNTATTNFSPWVASGSGGVTHIDWTIQQSNHVKKVTRHERILQTFLNAEYLKTILEKNDSGDFSPVSIVCNYFFEQMIYLEFNGKQIEVSNLNLEGISTYINVTKYRVKKKKAYLNFDYNGESVKMQLKKVNRNWKLHKLKAKNNSGKNIDITF